jgi:hypothetical protein
VEIKNKDMKKALIIITLLFIGCAKDAKKTVETTNANFKVELLFENDGCKVYRFEDDGHYVYYTDCRGKVESVYQQNTGKMSYEVRIQNETEK